MGELLAWAVDAAGTYGECASLHGALVEVTLKPEKK